jgi:hypothetical protein
MMVSLLMYSCEIANQQVYGIMGTFKIDNQTSFGGLCMQGCNGTHFCPIEMFKVRSLSVFDHYINVVTLVHLYLMGHLFSLVVPLSPGVCASWNDCMLSTTTAICDWSLAHAFSP